MHPFNTCILPAGGYVGAPPHSTAVLSPVKQQSVPRLTIAEFLPPASRSRNAGWRSWCTLFLIISCSHTVEQSCFFFWNTPPPPPPPTATLSLSAFVCLFCQSCGSAFSSTDSRTNSACFSFQGQVWGEIPIIFGYIIVCHSGKCL